MQSWTIQPVFGTTLLVVAAIVLIGLLFLGPIFSTVSVRRRFQLGMLRLGVLLLAFVALLRPGCIQEIEQSQSAVLLFLVDVSRSMELPHRADNSTRWQVLKETIKSCEPQIKKLAEQQVEVRFMGFSNDVVSLVNEGGVDLQSKPTGSETDIGSAIFKQSRDARGERMLGVVVHSDFVQNASDPEIEISRSTDVLRDLQVPLYAVQYGMPGDNGQFSDVAVTNLPEQHRIAVKNELNVKATISARGFANQPVTVKLLVLDKNGEWQPEDTVQFTPEKASEQKQVTLKYIPKSVGQFRMKVRVEQMTGEVALRNNELPSFLTVREGGIRILYLSGNNSWWEQRDIRNSLRRAAQDFDVVFKKIRHDADAKRSWPLGGELTKLLNDETFDVIILGDVDSRVFFDPRQPELSANIDALIDGVENQGKGLLLLGGHHSFEPGLYHLTPLAHLFPVAMDMTERQGQNFEASPRVDLHINRDVKLVPRSQHYVTTLSQLENPTVSWERIPPLAGANRFVEAKDGAEVLLETESGRPILVATELGGRILAFAGDTTHRWRTTWNEDETSTFAAEFDTFWRQAILWLAFKERVENNSVSIDLPKRRFKPRGLVQFRVRVGQDLKKKEHRVVATLQKPDGTTAPIVVNREGQVELGEVNRNDLTQPGAYKILAKGIAGSFESKEDVAEFVVFDQDKEKSNAAADLEQGQRLASQTEAFGGCVVYPEDFQRLLDQIIESPKEMKVSVPLKWQLGSTLPDASLFLLVFVGLLTAEWFLRKKWGLV